MKTVARLALSAFVAGAAMMFMAGPAAADGTSSTGATACGSASYCVQVTYTGTAAPSGGGGGGAVASVPPKCYWAPWKNPEAALEYMKNAWDDPLYTGKEWVLGYGQIEKFEKALKDNPEATWYQLQCPGLPDGDWAGQVEYAGAAAAGNGWTIPNMVLLVPPGQEPPAPQVDVEVLRDAAYDSLDIPDPDIQRNPDATVGSAAGATLVNLDTMFWADGYDDEYWIQAQVGNAWARVTAAAQDFVLTSPAGGQSCTHEQFTTPYTGGDAPAGACAFPFTKASVGYANGFPVTATAAWQASWTSSESATPAPLPPVTTDTTVNVPVAESQALVRTVR